MVYQHIEYAKIVGGTKKKDLHLKELNTIVRDVLRAYHSIRIKHLAKRLTWQKMNNNISLGEVRNGLFGSTFIPISLWKVDFYLCV